MTGRNHVLLITSVASQNTVQDSIALSYGLHLLQNSLNINDIECDVIDLEITSESECLNIFESTAYNIVGISVTHSNMSADLDFLHKIKKIANRMKRKCLFIAGGMSATLNCEAWLKGGFDVVFLGYAERSLLNFCHNYSDNNEWDSYFSLLSQTDGVVFKAPTGETVFNPSKVLTQEVFEYQMYTLPMGMEMPYEKYWEFMRSKNTDSLFLNRRSFVIENARLYTSSRCLARCGYCCCPAFVPTSQNAASVSIMLSAVQIFNLVVYNINKYSAKSFSINDEDFLVGNVRGINRVADFCDLIIAAKRSSEMPDYIKFSCQTRAGDFVVPGSSATREVNVGLIKKMAEAGFHNVSLGIETFSERLIRVPSVNKLNITAVDYHNVLQKMMEHGLFPTINLIIGIPEETPDELLQTIEQTMSYVEKPCQISVNIKMFAYPGAPIWGLAEYPTKNSMWNHPETGEEIKVPQYYIPKDEKLADIVENLDQDTLVEIGQLKIKYNMSRTHILPRIAISLCVFNVIAKELGSLELSGRIEAKLDNLIITR